MDDKNGFVITNRDRVLRAWENSTKLVRNYQASRARSVGIGHGKSAEVNRNSNSG